MSSGCRQERWSTERAPHSSATGTERCAAELLDVGAQRSSPCSRATAPMRARWSLVKATDSTKMSSASTSHSRGERLRLVHPRVRGRSPAGRRARTARSMVIGCGDAPGERAAERAPRAPRRRATARSRVLPSNAVVPWASISAASASAWREHLLVARLRERPRRRPRCRRPSRAISSYGTPVTLRSYSSARQPANGQVRVAVDEAGEHGAARGVDLHRRRRDRPRSRRCARPRASRRRPVQRQLRRAVVAEVGEAVLGRAQHLGGAVQRRGGTAVMRPAAPVGLRTVMPRRIGMRTPSRSAASMASG